MRVDQVEVKANSPKKSTRSLRSIMVRWAAEQRVKCASDRALLLELASRVKPDGTCTARQDQLAEVLCLSVRTVKNAVARLISAGLLDREFRYGKRGYRTSSIYRLMAFSEPAVTDVHDECSCGEPTGNSYHNIEAAEGHLTKWPKGNGCPDTNKGCYHVGESRLGRDAGSYTGGDSYGGDTREEDWLAADWGFDGGTGWIDVGSIDLDGVLL